MPYLLEIRDDQFSIPAVKLRAAVGEQRLYIRLLAFPAYDLFLNELDGTPAARLKGDVAQRSKRDQPAGAGFAERHSLRQQLRQRGDIPAQLLWNEMRDVAVVIKTAQ